METVIIARVIEWRKIIQEQLDKEELSVHALCLKLEENGEKVPRSTIYGFLQGQNDVNSTILARILDVMGFKLFHHNDVLSTFIAWKSQGWEYHLRDRWKREARERAQKFKPKISSASATAPPPVEPEDSPR